MMGFRVLLLAAMGLGAMYMLHLLAQDYNRIRRPVQAVQTVAKALLGKRDLSRQLNLTETRLEIEKNNNNSNLSHSDPNITAKSTPSASLTNLTSLSSTPQPDWIKSSHASVHINWNGILARDPFRCLQSLICQIFAGAEFHTAEARNIKSFIEWNLDGNLPGEIINAVNNGYAFRRSYQKCYKIYPICIYSARTMLRILRWTSYIFN